MRILLITDEVWNDKMYPNNVLTNWFEGFPAEIANIYLSAGTPDNTCCKIYFQVTDWMMLISLFTGKQAGTSFLSGEDSVNQSIRDCKNTKLELINSKIYNVLKKVPAESLRLLKDYIWLNGKYNKSGLEEFIVNFNPDIIFSIRLATRKILRLERIIARIARKPMVAFTGDDEYSLRQLRYSPVYWYRRMMNRKDLEKTLVLYRKYYTLSALQASFYRNLFSIETSVLMKSGDFADSFLAKPVHEPIKLIYAGKLYCNRWKTLLHIKNALVKINKEKIRMVLEIYTNDTVTQYQYQQLNDGVNSLLKPPVSAEELKLIYRSADIALHVEAFDLKNRLLTKYSFSTKIIDCLASSCAVIAICPREHPGFKYLKNNKGAICLERPDKIYPVLNKLLQNEEIFLLYQKRAWNLGIKNHQKVKVQQHLYQDLLQILNQERQAHHHENFAD